MLVRAMPMHLDLIVPRARHGVRCVLLSNMLTSGFLFVCGFIVLHE
jgi:hypothetical protein